MDLLNSTSGTANEKIGSVYETIPLPPQRYLLHSTHDTAKEEIGSVYETVLLPEKDVQTYSNEAYGQFLNQRGE